jgi:hypothetical protein
MFKKIIGKLKFVFGKAKITDGIKEAEKTKQTDVKK